MKDFRNKKGYFVSNVLSHVNVVDFDRLIVDTATFNADYLLDVLVNQLSLRPILENKNS
ncbi:MAG: hypothetical protein ACK521_03065 [bacterium]